MGSWLTERRLRRVAGRLRSRREELATLDEQIVHFRDEADDLAVRAVVSDDLTARPEARDAGRHLEAMRRHREHLVEEIAALEARQDELLDQMTA